MFQSTTPPPVTTKEVPRIANDFLDFTGDFTTAHVFPDFFAELKMLLLRVLIATFILFFMWILGFLRSFDLTVQSLRNLFLPFFTLFLVRRFLFYFDKSQWNSTQFFSKNCCPTQKSPKELKSKLIKSGNILWQDNLLVFCSKFYQMSVARSQCVFSFNEKKKSNSKIFRW